MLSEQVSYRADGATLRGYLVHEPDAGPNRPAVLVAPEARGLGEHARERARRLAALGYVAMAIDLYGEGRPAHDLQGALEWMRVLTGTPGRLRARARAALDALAAHPRVDPQSIAAIGFCLGGTAVLELAREGAPLSAVVAFH